MKILIQISAQGGKSKKVVLKLIDGKKEIDSFQFLDEYALSENLLPEIDKIIRKNQRKKPDIEKIEVASELDDNFTTVRIAKSLANSWNYGIMEL